VASVLKNCSPTPQLAGRTAPDLAGLVVEAPEASHVPDTALPPLIVVWPGSKAAAANAQTKRLLVVCFISISHWTGAPGRWHSSPAAWRNRFARPAPLRLKCPTGPRRTPPLNFAMSL